jgi:GDPmannose 4,6-dehydratase
MKKRVALIAGITGQDGSYLAEFLLGQGYEVHGIVRGIALEDPMHRLCRIRHLNNDLELNPASMESFASIHRVIRSVMPDECYHLAAQSFASYSFEGEFFTLNKNINGTYYMLAALHELAQN